MRLFERVKETVVRLGTSQTALAKELGLTQSKFNGYLNAKSEKNLWEHLPGILALYPQINRNWLYFNEGSIFKDPAENGLQSNVSGQAPGHLLANALSLLRLSEQDAIQRSGLELFAFRSILSGRSKPTFEQLEAMFFRLGINPVYFFNANEKWMLLPDDELMRVFFAIGLSPWIEPSVSILIDIFKISPDEASVFIDEWSLCRERGIKKSLPRHWLDILEACYGLNEVWITTGNPPLVTERQNDSTFKALENSYSELKDQHMQLLVEHLGLMRKLDGKTSEYKASERDIKRQDELREQIAVYGKKLNEDETPYGSDVEEP